MQIAVAVPRIKRFDGYRDEEIALSGVANALSARRVADALGLMQRVRHMIRESALRQKPLFPRRPAERGKEQKQTER